MVRQPGWPLSFEPAVGWLDATVVTYRRRAPDPGGVGTTINVVRETPAGKLQLHVSRRVTQAAQELRSFDLIESVETRVDDRPAVWLRFRFGSGEAVVEQFMVFVDPSFDAEGKVTIFSIATVPEYGGEAAAALSALLGTVRFDRRVGEGAPESRTTSHPVAEFPSQRQALSSGEERGWSELPPLIPIPGAR